MQPIWLDADALRRRLTMPAAIRAMRSAFVQLSEGRAEVPVRTAVQGGETTGLFMPGWLPDEEALGVKLVTVRPENAGSGHPVVQAMIALLNVHTGRPRALMDATWLTALRTGAASGLATELLARPDCRTLAVVGAGGQARAQIEAVLAVRPIREVRIRSRTGTSAERLAREVAAALEAGEVIRMDGESVTGVRIVAEPDPVRQLEGAEVIVTATDARDPVLPDGVADGCHINAVGAYTPEMCELPPSVVERARVVVDQRAAARAEAGDLHRAVAAGVFRWASVAAEIGEVAAGRVEGRRTPEEVTLFKSVGSAAQDLAVAAAALAGGPG